MKIKVRDVHPNPYRNIEHYPLNKEKIMALTNSIEKTGFWDNLVGRKVDGKAQIAYGHHRIEALRLANGYGYDFEFDLPIKDIDDGTMIQIMANENMQEWSHSVGVTDETVKVTKEYLENRPVPRDRPISGRNKQYQNQVNSPEIADFLGWSQGIVKESLKRLNLISEGIIEKEAVESLPTSRHADYFAKAIEKSKVKFTPQEQRQIAKEIVDSGDSRDYVKQRIEAKASEKEYGADFGKKKQKEKANQEIKEFDDELGKIADDIKELSDKFLKLKNLKDELQSVTSKKGLLNLKLLFMSFGSLEIRMQKFKDAMTENTEDITEDYINEVKQLNK